MCSYILGIKCLNIWLKWFQQCQQQQQQQKNIKLTEQCKKQLERTMQQLQEKLQMNLIQQTHLVQTADKTKTTDTLHQMALQQQQLVHQLQMTQRQYVLQHGIGLQPSVLPHPQQPKAGAASGKCNLYSSLIRIIGIHYFLETKKNKYITKLQTKCLAATIILYASIRYFTHLN